MKRAPETSDVGNRLELLRQAFGHEKQVNMVRFLGAPVTAQHWYNWESGRNLPDIASARLIARKTGVTLDWIFEGNRAGLALSIIERLEEAEKRLTSSRA